MKPKMKRITRRADKRGFALWYVENDRPEELKILKDLFDAVRSNPNIYRLFKLNESTIAEAEEKGLGGGQYLLMSRDVKEVKWK